jgi:hypothetical protein
MELATDGQNANPDGCRRQHQHNLPVTPQRAESLFVVFLPDSWSE